MWTELIPYNNDFPTHGIVITDHPLTRDELDDYYDDLVKIHPSLLTPVVVDYKDIDCTVWRSSRHGYSYPTIEVRVGYSISRIMDNETETLLLSSIYVFRNAKIVKELLDFLTDIDVSNMEDLLMARIYLLELHASLTPKP